MGHTEKPPLTVSAASKTCCVVSKAPTPEAKTWAGSFAVAAAPAFTSIVVVATQSIESAWSPQIEQDSSPPALQALLCTFLI